MLKKILLITLLLALIVVATSFAIKNNHAVVLNYYVATTEVPLSWVMAGAFAVGGAVSLFIAGVSLLRVRLRLLAETRKCRKLAEQCQQLMPQEED
jgi:lipopolysaccharide assembly protein A